MASSQRGNTLSQFQRNLLLAIHKDCRWMYHSRAHYDRDHRAFQHCGFDRLYDGWRKINRSLVGGDVILDLPDELSGLAQSLRSDPHGLMPGLTTTSIARGVRQLYGIFSRLDGVVEDTTSLVGWVDRVSSTRSAVPAHLLPMVRRFIARALGPVPTLMELVPKHGPGAVATGERGWQKATFSRLYRQHIQFGGEELFHLNKEHQANDPMVLKPQKHAITKVVLVPKDMRRQRVISAEPLEQQFLQQALMGYMMGNIERRCRQINFSSQDENRQLAKAWETHTTIDLSDASDHVSRRLVKQVFPADWSHLLFGLRSGFARIPGGRVVPLRSFAPMGSALCFPVEALVFAAVSDAAMRYARVPASHRNTMRVFGDDIIVPYMGYESVIDALRECGFKPNSDKCCVLGGFRESCGAEFLFGTDVTVVRPRHLDAIHPKHVAWTTIVGHANRLYANAFTEAASFLAQQVPYPVALGEPVAWAGNEVPSGYGHKDLPWRYIARSKWNRNLQRWEHITEAERSVSDMSKPEDGYKGLFMALTAGWKSDNVPTKFTRRRTVKVPSIGA